MGRQFKFKAWWDGKEGAQAGRTQWGDHIFPNGKEQSKRNVQQIKYLALTMFCILSEEEFLRAVWHNLDDSNGNKTHSLSPLVLMHKAGSSASVNPKETRQKLSRANVEIQVQGVTQISEYAEQDWPSKLVHTLKDHCVTMWQEHVTFRTVTQCQSSKRAAGLHTRVQQSP